jgi:hypothetical protein
MDDDTIKIKCNVMDETDASIRAQSLICHFQMPGTSN